MELIITQEQGRVPVTILRVRGEMDPLSTHEMAMHAREILAAGARYLLINLTDVPGLGWAGILAIDSILEFLLANRSSDEWRAMDEEFRSGTFKSPLLKLVNPSPLALRELRRAGTDMYLEIYPTLKDAVASFGLTRKVSRENKVESREMSLGYPSRANQQDRIASPRILSAWRAR
jgi:hypothetical protein